jgi:hypothetical protein
VRNREAENGNLQPAYPAPLYNMYKKADRDKKIFDRISGFAGFTIFYLKDGD